MNGRTNAKNGAGAIRDGCAVLEVRAPAWSQITAVRADGLTKRQSKGYVDLSNSDYWFYYIIIQKFELSNLKWIVTCTDGTNTKAVSVEITSEGQIENVALSYETYIYKQGETDITLNSDWALPSSPPVDEWRYSGDSVSLESDGSVKSSGGKLVRALKVDLTDVNELFFEVKISAYKYKGHVGVATAWPYSNSDFTYVAKTDFADTTDVQIVTVDTSALTGEYWVGGYFASLTTTNLYNIWY